MIFQNKTTKRFIKFLSLYFSFLTLCLFQLGCIKSPQKATNSNRLADDSESENRVRSASPLITGSPPAIGLQGVRYIFVPDTFSSGSFASGVGLPSWLTLNSSTGVLSGYPEGTATYNNLKIIVTKGSVFSEIGPFSLSVTGDPLFKYQWHILNNGQSNFASRGGSPGVDLNLEQVYKDGFLGVGINIAVSDSGLDLNHPDIDDNLLSSHKNYFLSSPFIGSPQPSTTGGDHGTAVAGIISAEGWNSIGGRGIAPLSRVAGLKYVGSLADVTRTLDQADGNFTIFNYSYGFDFTNYGLPWQSLYQDKLISMFTETGRNGLGSLYVKSAGNSYRECDFYYESSYLIEGNGLCYSHNANVDTDNVTIPMIVVGALNAKGQRASYSSVGSVLWVSAYGGEFGVTDPAILTIDQVGCNQGYSSDQSTGTSFEKGQLSINSNCDYTHTFNGTSAAAPMVTGIIALMLDANPLLSARDVKHILAITSETVNDSSFNGRNPHESSNFFSLTNHTYEQGWVTNAAGFSFHNHFGFGKVNGDAAINMAQNYVSGLGTFQVLNKDFSDTQYMANPGLSIPDESSVGATSTINISNNLTIEHVQIKLNITHGRPGDLGIELTSPSGTKSILFNINNSFLIPNDSAGSPSWVANLSNFVLGSNAFYGETSVGTWTLKVIDGLSGNTGTEFDQASSQTGILDDWSINISGH